MEIFGGILLALLLALAFTAIFYFALNSRGPWGSFWTFFLVLLFTIWAASLWVTPVGPVFWGVAWIPLFIVALVIGLLLAAIPTVNTEETEEDEEGIINRKPTPDPRKVAHRREKETDRRIATISDAFWIFLVVMLVVIIVGYTG